MAGAMKQGNETALDPGLVWRKPTEEKNTKMD